MSDTHRFGLYRPDENPPGDQVTPRDEVAASLMGGVGLPRCSLPRTAVFLLHRIPPRPTCFILVIQRAARPHYVGHPCGMLREGERRRAGFSALGRPPTGTFGEMGDSRSGMLLRPIAPPKWLFRSFGFCSFRERVSSLQPALTQTVWR